MNACAYLFLTLLAAQAPPPAVPLTVDAVIDIARANSPRLRAARSAAEASQVQADRERPVARPTVTISAEGTLQGPTVTFPRGATEDATVLPDRYGKIELRAEQTLWRPGLGAARTRYRALMRIAEWDRLRSENEILLDVRRAFYDLVLARAMLGVATEGRQVAARHRDQIADMLAAGLSSERDLKAADADLADAEQGLTRARNGVALAESNLNRLLGRSPSAPVDTLDPGPPPGHAETLEALCNQAEARRPELNLLRESIAAARAGAALARTEDKPTISARATAARQTASAFVDRNYFAGGLALTWDLLDGGKARLDGREADARCAELRAQLEDARLGIRLDVEKAWRDMHDAQARVEAAERQIDSARAALSISEARYETRMATQLEVSGAALGVTRALGNRAEALHDLYVADAELRHAIASDLRLPEPPSLTNQSHRH